MKNVCGRLKFLVKILVRDLRLNLQCLFHECFSHYFTGAKQMPDFSLSGELAANGLPQLKIKQEKL